MTNDDLTAALEMLESTVAPAFDIDALLAEARSKLKLEPKIVDDHKEVEAADANVVNALLARADVLKRAEDAAKKERAKITDTLAELAGTPNGVPIELKVHGATVFVVKNVTSRVLNTEMIKSVFPDIPENSELWKSQTALRRDYK